MRSISKSLPDGTTPVSARLLYCNEPRASFNVPRTMQTFALDVDPFSTYAVVKITAPEQEGMSGAETAAAITERLFVYLNGQRAAVVARIPERSILVVSGLEPKTRYRMQTTMMAEPASNDFTPEQRFETEGTQSIGNSSFEERRDGPTYSSMAAGGRFSQTVVPIFNWQQHRTFDMQIPKEWANTNSKTFNTGAANLNTWYVQPSAFVVDDDVQTGSFAVCIRSVGFDPDGAFIPDYTQTGQPYLQYSPIVPEVRYRAAGRLFLGTYRFDASTMTETYNDIVDWHTRPSSLNGYYKYQPTASDPSDAGLAIIEIYGEVDGQRQKIASGQTLLPVSNTYQTFSAQLDYAYFGVKATGIRILFASTADIGTIEEESRNVSLDFDAREARATGSTLWIDHVSLAY